MRNLKDDECALVSGARLDLVTTMAMGEEDGGWGRDLATTMAVGEEEPGGPIRIIAPLDSALHAKI